MTHHCPGPATCDHCDNLRGSTLAITLQFAVALRCDELARLSPVLRAHTQNVWRENAVDPVASQGDLLQFRGTKKGQAAQVFNHLARGMAALAHQPGGFQAFGLVWCARHSPGGAVPTTPLVCHRCADDEPQPIDRPVKPTPAQRDEPPPAVVTIATGGLL